MIVWYTLPGVLSVLSLVFVSRRSRNIDPIADAASRVPLVLSQIAVLAHLALVATLFLGPVAHGVPLASALTIWLVLLVLLGRGRLLMGVGPRLVVLLGAVMAGVAHLVFERYVALGAWDLPSREATERAIGLARIGYLWCEELLLGTLVYLQVEAAQPRTRATDL